MLLKDRVAVITGAASQRGLGQAMSILFAEHGARVIVLDIDEKASRDAAAALPGEGHAGYACNVTKKEQCERILGAILGSLGRIDVLVNNAGVTQPVRIMDIKPEDYDRILDVSLRGTLYMSQAVIPHMRGNRRGSIVNLSSVSAQRGGGIFGGPHYSAAKAGVLGLTKAMARELAPDNVRVNALCPAFIATGITDGQLSPQRFEEIVATIPMGRPGAPSEVAGCALFLASDLSSYCTGTEVDVNGGSHIH